MLMSHCEVISGEIVFQHIPDVTLLRLDRIELKIALLVIRGRIYSRKIMIFILTKEVFKLVVKIFLLCLLVPMTWQE